MEKIDLVLHYGGTWQHKPLLAYIRGEAVTIDDLDIDLLSVTHIIKKYSTELGVEVGQKLYVVKPGTKLSDGLFCLFTDADIASLTACILQVGVRQVHIYVNFEAENEDKGVPSLGSNIGTQHSFVQATANEPGKTHTNT